MKLIVFGATGKTGRHVWRRALAPRFLPPELADRVRRILTVLLLAEDIDDFIANAPGGWRVHRLSGDRRREWSVSVSGN